MAYTKLKPRHTQDSRVEEISGESSHYLLSIPAGTADQYRLAQLDDYAQTKKEDFPLRSPLSLSLSARVSSDSIPGTWGFGLWNDPFGLSLGFGGNPFRLPALPNAVWFFGASEESYLSFRNPRAERSGAQSTHAPAGDAGEREPHTKSPSSNLDFTQNHASTTPPTNGGSAQRGVAGNGFLAQTFRSPKFHPLLILAGMALPFSRKLTRRLLGKVIEEDGINLQHNNVRSDGQPPFGDASRLPVATNVTHWHRYRLDWRETRVSFEVDDALVFESPVIPHPPLGTVIWIDNQYAAFTPEGRIGFGVLENPEPAWLEVKDIEIK